MMSMVIGYIDYRHLPTIILQNRKIYSNSDLEIHIIVLS